MLDKPMLYPIFLINLLRKIRMQALNLKKKLCPGYLDAGELEVCKTDQAEGGPEEGLQRLEEVEESPPDEAGGTTVQLFLLRTMPDTHTHKQKSVKKS